MTKVKTLAKVLVSRRWLWVTVVVVILMGVLARLGFWQLDRLEQRRAENALLLAALESDPIDLNAQLGEYVGMAPGEVPDALVNRDVMMVGEYDFNNQRILKLQSWNGRAGVHLITPFLPNGTIVAVLVDRGWIPDSEYNAGNAFDEVTGVQTVEGYIAQTETISRRVATDENGASGPSNELFRVDVAALGSEFPYPLAPFYIKRSAASNVDASTLPIPVPKEVDLSEGPHLDYAMQWFIFSLGLGVAYVIYVNRSLKQTVYPHPDVDNGLSGHK